MLLDRWKINNYQFGWERDWRNDFRGGGSGFSGPKVTPLKTEKLSDLTNHFSKRTQFNKMIKIFSKKSFWTSRGGGHAMNLRIKYLMTTDATQKTTKS